MTKAHGKTVMAKLARVKHQLAQTHAQQAQLLVEEAKLYDELAEGETIDLRTGRLRPKYAPLRAPENVTPEEDAQIAEYLRGSELRRRIHR